MRATIVVVPAHRISDASAVAAMRAAGFEPLVPYPGSEKPWPAICTSCGHRVTPRWSEVKRRQDVGCPHCAGIARRLTEAEALPLLAELGLEPLAPFPGTQRPWPVRCQLCGAESAPQYSNLRYRTVRGCQHCPRPRPTR